MCVFRQPEFWAFPSLLGTEVALKEELLPSHSCEDLTAVVAVSRKPMTFLPYRGGLGACHHTWGRSR